MTGNATFDDYTFMNRWGLTFLGIWKTEKCSENRAQKFLHQIHVGFLFFLLLTLMVPEWFDFYIIWGDLDAFIETFMVNVFTMTVFFKLASFIVGNNDFQALISTLKENWKMTMNGKKSKHVAHQKILLEMAETAREYTIRYGFLMYSTATIYFISPFVGMQRDGVRERKYPFFGWYYFDRFSDLYYVLCYAIQVMAGIVVGTGNYAMDSICLVAIYHTCARLRMLQYDLQRMGEEDDFSAEKINDFIREHQIAIRNAQKLDKIFNVSSMQQLIVSCIIICSIGFKLILALNEGGVEVFQYMAFMFVALLQILLYCQPGDELITQSAAIGDAAYQSSWTSFNPKAVRKVASIILRSQKPIQITAGKIYILSIPNFTMILKTSMSFLSLCRAMYSKTSRM